MRRIGKFQKRGDVSDRPKELLVENVAHMTQAKTMVFAKLTQTRSINTILFPNNHG
jgi:hypothetical protein